MAPDEFDLRAYLQDESERVDAPGDFVGAVEVAKRRSDRRRTIAGTVAAVTVLAIGIPTAWNTLGGNRAGEVAPAQTTDTSGLVNVTEGPSTGVPSTPSTTSAPATPPSSGPATTRGQTTLATTGAPAAPQHITASTSAEHVWNLAFGTPVSSPLSERIYRPKLGASATNLPGRALEHLWLLDVYRFAGGSIAYDSSQGQASVRILHPDATTTDIVGQVLGMSSDRTLLAIRTGDTGSVLGLYNDKGEVIARHDVTVDTGYTIAGMNAWAAFITPFSGTTTVWEYTTDKTYTWQVAVSDYDGASRLAVTHPESKDGAPSGCVTISDVRTSPFTTKATVCDWVTRIVPGGQYALLTRGHPDDGNQESALLRISDGVMLLRTGASAKSHVADAQPIAGSSDLLLNVLNGDQQAVMRCTVTGECMTLTPSVQSGIASGGETATAWALSN